MSLTVLPGNSGSVSCSHITCLTAICESSFKGSDTFWIPWAAVHNVAHIPMHIRKQVCKNKNLKNISSVPRDPVLSFNLLNSLYLKYILLRDIANHVSLVPTHLIMRYFRPLLGLPDSLQRLCIQNMVEILCPCPFCEFFI